jgi:hypothetical protein
MRGFTWFLSLITMALIVGGMGDCGANRRGYGGATFKACEQDNSTGLNWGVIAILEWHIKWIGQF